MEKHQLLRELPSVDSVLGLISADIKSSVPHQIIVEQIRGAIAKVRKRVLADEAVTPEAIRGEEIARVAEKMALAYWQPNLRPVINATGVVLHTNLGRAALGAAAREALSTVAGRYCNLELELETGERGSRYSHVVELLCRLTGAEAALVVNNNAAAVLLALNTLAQGKEVIVSRGQLVEIGGAFRVPEVMAAGGARLVEVGTTNKTYPEDYRKAVTEDTALLLKVHPSNYRITGFTRETTLEELVALSKETGVPVMEDLGSGFLADLKHYGITGEPTVMEEIKAGVDIVTFSGDKLLGGPQAGIIVGKKEYVERMAKNQLTRALRVDKLTMAALEATLRAYLWEPEQTREMVPILAMLTTGTEVLEKRARELAARLDQVFNHEVQVVLEKGVSQAGGGSLPTLELPTVLVTLSLKKGNVEDWARSLRQGEPAVMARIGEGKLLLDLRTVFEDEEEHLINALAASLPG